MRKEIAQAVQELKESQMYLYDLKKQSENSFNCFLSQILTEKSKMEKYEQSLKTGIVKIS